MGVKLEDTIPLYRAMYLGEKEVLICRHYMAELDLLRLKTIEDTNGENRPRKCYVYEFNPRHFRETIKHIEVFDVVIKRITYIESIISDIIQSLYKDSRTIDTLDLEYIITEGLLRKIILKKYKDFKNNALSDVDTELTFIVNTIKYELNTSAFTVEIRT